MPVVPSYPSYAPPPGAGHAVWLAAARRYAADNQCRQDKAEHYAALGALVARGVAQTRAQWQDREQTVDAISSLTPGYVSGADHSSQRGHEAALAMAGPLRWHRWLDDCRTSGMAVRYVRWHLAMFAADCREQRVADETGAGAIVAEDPAGPVATALDLSARAHLIGYDRSAWYGGDSGARWVARFDPYLSEGYRAALAWRSCEGCRVRFRSDPDASTFYDWRDRHCPECNRDMHPCVDCCGPVDPQNYGIEFADGWRCEPCADSWVPENVETRGYSWVPDAWKWGRMIDGARVHTLDRGDPDVLMLGVEVELETNGDRSGYLALSEWSGVAERVAYCKDDGSLADGVEVVTHPMTLDAHRDLWAAWPGHSLRMSGWEADTAETAGMHVHASRDAFAGRSHLARFGMFWFANEGRLVDLVGRRSTYADWTDAGRRDVVKHATKRRQGPRYSPVNYQPYQTVECRAFRSSFSAEYIVAAVELVHAIHAYTAPLRANDVLTGALEFDRLAAWITATGDYSSLNQLIETTERI